METFVSTGTKKKISYIIYFFNRVNIYTYLPSIEILSIILFFFGKINLHELNNRFNPIFKFDMHKPIFIFLYKLHIPVYTRIIFQDIYKLYIPYIYKSFFIRNINPDPGSEFLWH